VLERAKDNREKRRQDVEEAALDLKTYNEGQSAMSAVKSKQAAAERQRIKQESSRQREEDKKNADYAGWSRKKAMQLNNEHRQKLEREEADQAAREAQAAKDRAKDRAEEIANEMADAEADEQARNEMRAEKRRQQREAAERKARVKAETDAAFTRRFNAAEKKRVDDEKAKEAAEKEEAREMAEALRQKAANEAEMKRQWAQVRGDASKSASALAFEQLAYEEQKQRKNNAAHAAFAAQEAQFRADREEVERQKEERERLVREREGQRVRDTVLVRAAEAEAHRRAETKQAAADLALHMQEEARQQAVVTKQKAVEAERTRKAMQAQRNEGARLKKEAKDKEREFSMEHLAKGMATKKSVQGLKEAQEQEVMNARKREWIERQKKHEADVQAEVDHLNEVHKEFNEREHGAHLHTALGDAW